MDDISAYRSELQGIHELLMVIKAICTIYKIGIFSCYQPEKEEKKKGKKGKRKKKKREKERKREKTLVQVTNKIYSNKNEISNPPIVAPTMVNKSIHLL